MYCYYFIVYKCIMYLFIIFINLRIKSKNRFKTNYHQILLFIITPIKIKVAVYYVYIRIYRIKGV